MTAHPAHAPSAPAVPRAAPPKAASAHQTREQEQETTATPRASHVAHEPIARAVPSQTAAAFFASSHHHWRAHSDHHFAVRKQMIGRLQRLHPLLATNTTMRYAGTLTRIPELVQRLELMLYKAAASLDEYTNVCTLERRVHSLVTLLEPLPPVEPLASRKRRCAATSSSLKRRRVRSTSSVRCDTATASSSSGLTTELSADLLGHVFTFVDGAHTLRSCSLINRFFHREAPRLVFSLSIDVGSASHARALHGRVASALGPLTNLRSLAITNSRNVGKKNGFTRAFQGDHGDGFGIVGTPAAFAAATDPLLFTGRVLLHELSELLYRSHHVVFPKLSSLELSSPFDCANEADSTLQFLRALAVNSSLKFTSRPALERLALDTTVLGDRRMPRLLALFHEFPLVFQKQLRVLELSNNFVGEAGMSALCRSLAASWPRLETLGLRRNIITDAEAHQLALIVSTASVLPRLSQLDVSENFIGKPGFETLAKRLKSGDESRGRIAILTTMNCMESTEAAHLFM